MLTSAICASVQRDALKSKYLRDCCRVLHSGRVGGLGLIYTTFCQL